MKNALLVSLLLFSIGIASNAPVTQILQTALKQGHHQLPVWIYFKDKGPALKLSENLISQRAIERRQKVKAVDNLISFRDFPVYQPYMDTVQPFVKKMRTVSRWLNAVSADVDPQRIDELRALKIIQKIDLVKSYRKPAPIKGTRPSSQTILHKTTALDYGPSFTQVDQIKVTRLHEEENFGEGVLICMLDDGFNLYNTHECFDSLNVVATWDFIHDDESVDDPEASPVEGWHGTKTLSAIAGYKPGQLIGPAFKAAYMLGKTEDDNSETPVEEDYWVEGLEWAEMNGADLVSSSLGYIDWYTWEDMDGETAVTTIAADIAVANGMIVVNSAGNEGYSSSHNTLIAPADADLVIAAGAVTSEGERSSFSSVGPTADGRIKPEVAAMGSSVYVASYTDPQGYTYSSGTSFSCPLISGAIALLLSENPQLTPMEVREALIETSSQSGAPDNLLGWGIIDIDAANDYVQVALTGSEPEEQPLRFTLEQNYPNPFNNQTTIRYTVGDVRAYNNAPSQVSRSVETQNNASLTYVTLSVYNVLGEQVTTLVDGFRATGQYEVSWNAAGMTTGVYFYSLKIGDTVSESRKMILLQ